MPLHQSTVDGARRCGAILDGVLKVGAQSIRGADQEASGQRRSCRCCSRYGKHPWPEPWGGVIGMLGDHHAAGIAQSGSGVGLPSGVGPGAHELDLHGDGGADALGLNGKQVSRKPTSAKEKAPT